MYYHIIYGLVKCFAVESFIMKMKFKEFSTKFGKEIKKMRIDNDISQEALAGKAGLHVTLLSRIEQIFKRMIYGRK